jgi:hypothetical protein
VLQSIITVLIVVLAFGALFARLMPMKLKKGLLRSVGKLFGSNAPLRIADQLKPSGCGACSSGSCCDKPSVIALPKSIKNH